MTNHEISGQTNFEGQLDNILDEYNRDTQTNNCFTGDIYEYLNMSQDELGVMSKEDRYTASLRLAQFSIYVQRLINREKSRQSFATAAINKAAAPRWDSFSEYLSYEIKVQKLAKESPLIDKAIRIRNNAKIRIEELDNLAMLIKHFSEMMMRSSYVGQ